VTNGTKSINRRIHLLKSSTTWRRTLGLVDGDVLDVVAAVQ
jgi:hypothetical protein